MAGRLDAGGILALLDLIEEHRAALEYDFRTRFSGVRDGLAGIPEQVGWGEALRLIQILRDNPSSMVAAAMRKWKYPVSRAEVIAMDQYDLTYAATGAKTKHKYPRPFETDDRARQIRGNTRERPLEDTKAILRKYAEGAPV